MSTSPLAPLIEEQLDVTLRFLLGLSTSMTVSEVESVRSRLAQTHLAMGYALALRDSGPQTVVSLGRRMTCLSHDY